MARAYVTVRVCKDGTARYVVRYRLSGRAGALRHAGTFRSREEADAHSDRLNSAIAGGELLPPRRTYEGQMVYFGRVGPLMKIGISFRPLHRCASLGAELLFVEPGGRARERVLHRMFKPDHVRGEWFNASRKILEYIDRMAAKQDEDAA